MNDIDPRLWPRESSQPDHDYYLVAYILAARWLTQAAAGEVPHGGLGDDQNTTNPTTADNRQGV
jgi:hypothetical protein